jgi:hypothetical protein
MADRGRALTEASSLIAKMQRESAGPVELTRAQIAVARDWYALPENERVELAQAIAMRAAWWRMSDARQAAADRRTYECSAGARSLVMWRPCGNGGALPPLADNDDDDD